MDYTKKKRLKKSGEKNLKHQPGKNDFPETGMSFLTRPEKQFPRLPFSFLLKWSGQVSSPVIKEVSLSVIAHVMVIVPVSTPHSLHLLNHKATMTAVSNTLERYSRGMPGTVIQLCNHSVCLQMPLYFNSLHTLMQLVRGM